MKMKTSAATILFSASVFLRSTAFATDYDRAYIHIACSLDRGNYPIYDNDTNPAKKMGPGWYCSDGYFDAGMAIDNAMIISGCDFGVHYCPINKEWYCKDDWRGTKVDLAFIHYGCTGGVEYMTNSDCQGRYGSNCAFGDLPNYEGAWYCKDQLDVSNNDPSDFDHAFILPGCTANGNEPVFNKDLKLWYCGATSVVAKSRSLLRGGETSDTN